jgi:phosphomannomutase
MKHAGRSHQSKGYPLPMLTRVALIYLGSLAIAISSVLYLLLVDAPNQTTTDLREIETLGADTLASELSQTIRTTQGQLRNALNTQIVKDAIESADSDRIGVAQQFLQPLFPEAISLQLIHVDELGSQSLLAPRETFRNNLEADLVRRSREGLAPPEAYAFGDRVLISTAVASDWRSANGAQGVLLLSQGPQYISNILSTLTLAQSAAIDLQQKIIQPNGQTALYSFFRVGEPSGSGHTQAIAGSQWQLSYRPGPMLAATAQSNFWGLVFALLVLLLCTVMTPLWLLITARRYLRASVAEIANPPASQPDKSLVWSDLEPLLALNRSLSATVEPEPIQEPEPVADASTDSELAAVMGNTSNFSEAIEQVRNRRRRPRQTKVREATEAVGEMNDVLATPVSSSLKESTLSSAIPPNSGRDDAAATQPPSEIAELSSAETEHLGDRFQLVDRDDDDNSVPHEGVDLSSGLTAPLASASAPVVLGGRHLTVETLPQEIFRAYDIRGIAATQLDDAIVEVIAAAIATVAADQGEHSIVVASDGRLSSPRIKTVLVQSLLESGINVVDIGVVPSPVLYFATHHLAQRSGLMITGSHSDPEVNGIKLVLDQKSPPPGTIEAIFSIAQAGIFPSGSGALTRENVLPAYIQKVCEDILLPSPLKVVLDASNGVAGKVAPEIFSALGCNVIPLFCDIDGNFPNHFPDTSNEANLTQLCDKVRQERADFGVAFDGDADRLAVVDSEGTIIRTDRLMMILARDVLTRNPGADVVYDVKCSHHLGEIISKWGGRPILWKTGHALMKQKIREQGAILGGEFSGHVFFCERWFGFDDGIYAAARVAEIISTEGKSLIELVADLPPSVSTPEILIASDDNEKFALIEQLVEQCQFEGGKINTIDGLRVDFPFGWGLVRASNTTGALTLRFEADSTEQLMLIQSLFRSELSRIKPTMELPF